MLTFRLFFFFKKKKKKKKKKKSILQKNKSSAMHKVVNRSISQLCDNRAIVGCFIFFKKIYMTFLVLYQLVWFEPK
jgi:hypothetical protein